MCNIREKKLHCAIENLITQSIVLIYSYCEYIISYRLTQNYSMPHPFNYKWYKKIGNAAPSTLPTLQYSFLATGQPSIGFIYDIIRRGFCFFGRCNTVRESVLSSGSPPPPPESDPLSLSFDGSKTARINRNPRGTKYRNITVASR